MTRKPLEAIHAPNREDLCNGSGYFSPTETAALNNVYREAYRAKEETRYVSVKPPPPRVNQATTVQLEQELARRRAEERKRRSADEQKAYIEARKKARQMQIVFTTLCKVVGFDFVGTIAFKSLETGDVFGPEDFKPQNDKREE